MNTIRTHARWPARIRLLLWLLVLVPVFLSGCKSQPPDSTRVKTSVTNLVVVLPPGSAFATNPGPGAATNTCSSICDPVLHFLHDLGGVVTDVKKTTDQLRDQNASEILTIQIVIVMTAGGLLIWICVLIYLAKTRGDLLEEMKQIRSSVADLSQQIDALELSEERKRLEQALASMSEQVEAINIEIKPRPETAEALAETEELRKALDERFRKLKARAPKKLFKPKME